MLALKDSCFHPTSQQPYIKSASGGKDNSPEGIQVSVTSIPHGKLLGKFTNVCRMGLHTHLS
jgi:hypothetical protein